MKRLVLCFILVIACFLIWDMGDYESSDPVSAGIISQFISATEISNSELSQNYPNPFNLATTDYSILKSGSVGNVIFSPTSLIDINLMSYQFEMSYDKDDYALAGQKVRTMVNEHQASPCEDGLYFYSFVDANEPERWQCISHKEDNSLHLINAIKMAIYANESGHDVVNALHGSVLLI